MAPHHRAQPVIGRRAFLTALGAIGIGSQVAQGSSVTADSGARISGSTAITNRSSGGWTFHWLDYQHPANQLFEVGAWCAFHPRLGTRCLVAPTTGYVQQVGELEVFDTALKPGWPVITPHSSPDIRTHAKQMARSAVTQAAQAIEATW
jgi:hypothetical protein